MSISKNFQESTDDLLTEEKGVKAGPDRVLVPDAQYEAQAIGYKIVPYKNTRKIYLKLNIVTLGPYFGTKIWIVFQEYSKRYGARSYFYKAWVIAHGIKPQGRKIKPNDLCGKIYHIKTRTVIKDEDGDLYPAELRYSVAKIIGLSQDNGTSSATDNQSPKTNYRLPTSPSISSKGKRSIH